MPCHVANIFKKPRGFESQFRHGSFDIHKKRIELMLLVVIVCYLRCFGRRFRRLVTVLHLLHFIMDRYLREKIKYVDVSFIHPVIVTKHSKIKNRSILDKYMLILMRLKTFDCTDTFFFSSTAIFIFCHSCPVGIPCMRTCTGR